MTCYDCAHCEACSDIGDSGFSALKEDVSKCKHFKNKADYVEVRHGEWEAKEHTSISTNRHYYTFRCSECKRWNGTHRQNYCPNCGAKMDGGKNEQV